MAGEEMMNNRFSGANVCRISGGTKFSHILVVRHFNVTVRVSGRRGAGWRVSNGWWRGRRAAGGGAGAIQVLFDVLPHKYAWQGSR